MENDERPSKLRKLNQSPASAAIQSKPLLEHELSKDEAGAAEYIGSRNVAETDLKLGAVPGLPIPENGECTVQEPVIRPDSPSGLSQTIIDGASVPPLSKNGLKKLRRKQEWEANREHRKAVRKAKLKAKKERKRAEHDAAIVVTTDGADSSGPLDRQDVTGALTSSQSQEPQGKQRGRSTQLPITFILDCSWDELMSEKEITSLASQLTRCYSDNHKARYRAHLAVSSFEGRMKERFNTILSRQYEGWKGVHFQDEDFVEVAKQAQTWMAPEKKGGFLKAQFEKYQGQEQDLQDQAEVVYLSSDSGETLTELKPYSTYVIGGLVDKNRYKGVCYKKACDRGIKTAKLPIGDHIQMASRNVLTVNHVNDIMLKWLECGDWGQAFAAVIPKRKGGVLKSKGASAKETETKKVDAEEAKGEVEETADLRQDVNEAFDNDHNGTSPDETMNESKRIASEG